MFWTRTVLLCLVVGPVFDKVCHEGLMHKIKRTLLSSTYNIRQSYLIDPKFRVKYNDYVTRDYDIMAGVNKESILGPTVYLIFTVDLPIIVKVLTEPKKVITWNLKRTETP